MANVKSIGGNPIVPESVAAGSVTDAMLAQTGGVLSAVGAISYLTEIPNLIDISSDTLLKVTDDTVSIAYDSDVQIDFTATANPIVYWALDGLTVGHSYTLSFDLLAGSLGSTSVQSVCVWDYATNSKFSTVATATKNDDTYAISFTPSVTNLALQVSLIYSSKSVTLGNFTLTDDAVTVNRVVRNDAVVDLPETSLDADLRAKIDGNDLSNVMTQFGTDSNLLDATTLTSGMYINGGVDGEPTATGSAYSVTDYIEMAADTPYYWHNIVNGYWAFYDASKDYISGSGYKDSSTDGYVLTPGGTAYGRFTVPNANVETAWINTVNAEPTGDALYAINANVLAQGQHPENPCDYDGTEIGIFHKGLCIGDSLTAGVCNYNEGGTQVINVTFPNYAYPTYLSKLTGCEVTRLANAGATTAQWYAAHENDDLSGYDFAIIQLGINDAIANQDWTTEQADAMDDIITKLKSDNNNIKIFVATIIPAISYVGSGYDSVSEGLRSYVEDLDDDDVVLLDMAAYGHTKEQLAYNAGHLTAYGYMMLAMDYKAYISWYIANHKMQFRQVQFIGTEHSFT